MDSGLVSCVTLVILNRRSSMVGSGSSLGSVSLYFLLLYGSIMSTLVCLDLYQYMVVMLRGLVSGFLASSPIYSGINSSFSVIPCWFFFATVLDILSNFLSVTVCVASNAFTD